jgi:hypothetical protein
MRPMLFYRMGFAFNKYFLVALAPKHCRFSTPKVGITFMRFVTKLTFYGNLTY